MAAMGHEQVQQGVAGQGSVDARTCALVDSSEMDIDRPGQGAVTDPVFDAADILDQGSARRFVEIGRCLDGSAGAPAIARDRASSDRASKFSGGYSP